MKKSRGVGMIDVARLRECPFCGSSNVALWHGQLVGTRPDNGMGFVHCLNCGASSSHRQRDDAVRCWNERAHENGKKDD